MWPSSCWIEEGLGVGWGGEGKTGSRGGGVARIGRPPW